ncbi:MAG: Stp1/IreP family PP2C-type Ser/Thr phosphatase [Acidimicrobiales bacterium]
MATDYEHLVFRAAESTHVGMLREVNQDAAFLTPDVFVVADGMGGHAAGDIASAIAVASIADMIRMAGVDDLVEAVKAANKSILKRADSEPELAGMGTTVVALASFIEADVQQLALVNVGDSRAYRLSGDELSQLTDDHSLVADLVRDGMLRADQAEHHPQKNILTRALGIEQDLRVDSWVHQPIPGDRYLLCSDGLFNEVSEDDIAEILRSYSNVDNAAAELVAQANAHGGRDNITVMIVDVVDPASAESTEEPAANDNDEEADDASTEVADDSGDELPKTEASTTPEPDQPAAPPEKFSLRRMFRRQKGNPNGPTH